MCYYFYAFDQNNYGFYQSTFLVHLPCLHLYEFKIYTTKYFFNLVFFSKLNISLTVCLYVLLPFTPPNFSHIFQLQPLWMTSLHAIDCSIPFTIPLGPNGVVVIQESYLSLNLAFNWTSCIHVEQKLLHGTGVLCEKLFVQNSGKDIGSFWTLGKALSKSQVCLRCKWISSTMLLTNESITTTLQSNGMCRVEIDPSLEDVMLLSDSDNEGTHMVDLAMNLTSLFKVSSLSQHLVKQGFNTWHKLTTMWKASWGLSHQETHDKPTTSKIALDVIKEVFLLKSGILSISQGRDQITSTSKEFFNYKCDMYLKQPTQDHRAYCNANHRLAIEIGQWSTIPISRDNVVCHFFSYNVIGKKFKKKR